MHDHKTPPAIAFLAGFLGAGKTTLIARSAAWLHARGRRVAVLTNDQVVGLVDTRVLGLGGLRVAEVAGGSFGCRYDELAERRVALADADVILAEPAGSCADLAATVLRPWIRDHGDRVLPLSVLVAPARLGQALNPRTPGPLPYESAYILHKQLEEADVIVLSKCSTSSERTREHDLARLADAFPDRCILAVDALSGEGFDEWTEAIFGALASAAPRARDAGPGQAARGAGGQRGIEVDYDVYAAGEAGLGWLNARITLAFDARTSGARLARELLEDVRQRLQRQKAELVHGKLLLVSGDHVVRANLVDAVSAPSVEGEIVGPAQVELVVNARAVLGPAQLRVEFLGSLWHVAKDAAPTLLELSCLAPARPAPQHRIEAERTGPAEPERPYILPVESLPLRRKIVFAGGAGLAALFLPNAPPAVPLTAPFADPLASPELRASTHLPAGGPIDGIGGTRSQLEVGGEPSREDG